MTIEELNARIGLTICEIDDISIATDECKNLSIEFAISVLEDLKFRFEIMSDMSTATHGYKFLQNKIQELKEYLDEI